MTGLPATALSGKLMVRQCATPRNKLILLTCAGLDGPWVAAWVVLPALALLDLALDVAQVAGREGTGQFGAGDRRERTGGLICGETPLAKFSNFFLFFTYPLTRTSESSDALHRLAAMPVRPHRYPCASAPWFSRAVP